MGRFKVVDYSARFLPVDLSRQLLPGTFEFALHHLLEHELDLSEIESRYCNDEVGASAYEPRILLKIVLLGYARGILSSRAMEAACRDNVQFIALSGDAQPDHSTLARFVSELGEAAGKIFTRVLLICDRQGLIGRVMFAIDGVKLPSNASKARPISSNWNLVTSTATFPTLNYRKRDPRYDGQEQHRGKPDALWDKSTKDKTKIRLFGPGDFQVAADFGHVICPAGKRLYRNGGNCNKQGLRAIQFSAAQRDCGKCPLRAQCLRHPQRSKRRQVAIFLGKHASAKEKASDRMKRKIDSERGREMITRRFATVEPVFGNVRANKKMNRFTLRGEQKVDGQWKLYCMVQNIEKLAHNGYGR